MAQTGSMGLLKNLGSRLWPYGLLIFCVLLVYANATDNAFLLDDEMLIQKNQYLRHSRYLSLLLTHCSTAGFGGEDSFWRPLQGLLYFGIFQNFGLMPFPFHVLNIVLHAANACMVYVLGRKLGFAKSAVIAGALLWSLHPAHTEAVAYISATADPLYVFFCLGGLIVLFPNFSLRRFCLSGIFFAFALLAKETAIVFPLLALLCLFYASDKRLQPATYLRALPLVAVAILYFWVRINLLHIDDFSFYKTPNFYTESIYVRFLTFLATIPAYLHTFFWPDNLHMDHMFMPIQDLGQGQVWIGGLVVLAAMGFIGWSLTHRGKDKELVFGLTWFPFAHVLHSGLFLAVNSIFLEHWLYLPTIGLMLGSSEFLHQQLDKLHIKFRTPIIVTLVVCFATLLGYLTFTQNKLWQTPIVFYENILSYGEPSASAHNNLAMAYSATGDEARAIDHYRAAIIANDSFPQTHYNLGVALFNTASSPDQRAEAIQEIEKAIAMNPRFFQAYDALYQIFKGLGENKKAELYRKKEVEILKTVLPDVN